MSGSRRRASPADSLLNFVYPLPVQPASENTFRRGPLRHSVPFNKKRHVRANFRFALSGTSNESKDVSSSVEFVDDPIDWDKVILVNQLVEHPPYCPICLDVLIAPRITKCGHSTCLKCILHYFSLSQRNYARCVLCAEPVYTGDLRCLTFDICPSYKEKDDVTFVLCRRSNSSSDVVPLAPVEVSSPFQFRSIIVGLDLRSIYRKEQDDIINALLTAERDEIPFFQMALDCVEKLMSSPMQDIATSVRNLTLSTSEPIKSNACEEKEYYFYQCLDGQLLFLNSLSFRCLLHEYGSVENLPSKITAPILDVVRIRQTEGFRSKYRFIGHLPITTNYSLCDVELKSLVKKTTLNHFREELNQQSKLRAKQKAQQKKDEKKMKALNEEREMELRQRSRNAGPFPEANPFGFVTPEEFGPAIGNAPKPASSGSSVGAWSAVADKGLMASEAWEPLPSRRSEPPPLHRPRQISTMVPDRTAVSFSSIVGSQSTQAASKAKKGGQTHPPARQTILFSNAGNRIYKN